MNKIKIVSFDVEGTLVTTDFSYAIWFEGIPQRYAERHGLTIEQAKNIVRTEYEKIGDQRPEWYDIKYWFTKFDLGNHEPSMEQYHHKVGYYPEVMETLTSFSKNYKLIATSGSAREFLSHLLRDIEPHFYRVFSSTSDQKQPKTQAFYLKICQDLKVMPGQILHVGDNWQFDYVSARDIGINAVFLDRNGTGNFQDSINNLKGLQDRLRI
jgi:HAD superfamily hydrolase (TIGR01549 family)